MSRTARSRAWKIKENGSLSAGALLGGGHFVFRMTNDEIGKIFIVRFTGGGTMVGGGFSVNPDALFNNIGWARINSPGSFSMDHLNGASGKLYVAGLSLMVGYARVEISAWERTGESGMREGILFTDAVISEIKVDTPTVKPKVSLIWAGLNGFWSVDSHPRVA